ncbi:hypothetical protein [Halobaculum sp. MBLA0143]|uniref:hypothetical protein n=1 Tax=Halobaculum sp. MBLA0143 TaxID=3079933 RepID=UPI0035239B72
MTPITDLLRAVVTMVVAVPTFLACLGVFRRLDVQPTKQLSSVHQASHEVDRDLTDRVAPLLFYLALFASMAVGFVVAELVV